MNQFIETLINNQQLTYLLDNSKLLLTYACILGIGAGVLMLCAISDRIKKHER